MWSGVIKVVHTDFLLFVFFPGALLVEHAASSVGTAQDVCAAQRLDHAVGLDVDVGGVCG